MPASMANPGRVAMYESSLPSLTESKQRGRESLLFCRPRGASEFDSQGGGAVTAFGNYRELSLPGG